MSSSGRTTTQAAEPQPMHIPVTKLTPIFKLVFLSVFGITILAFVGWGVLSLAFPQPSDEAKGFFQACSTITQLGFGAIVGLIGGKAA
jgi:predicted permease